MRYWSLHFQHQRSLFIEQKMCSSPLIRKVIIIGAGGHLGPHLVSAFDTDPHFQVSILSRASSDCSRFPSHIPSYCVGENYDTSESELVELLRGQDAIISAIAAQAVQQQKTIINAALKAGVKYFVPSEFGHDTRNEQLAQLLPPFLVTQKRQIVEYLQSKEVEGLKWTAFVTGPFFEM
jgi:saccharopine dehydrogenase-like NADP-dependent oxidoreductase